MANDKKLSEDQIDEAVKQLLRDRKIEKQRTITASKTFDPPNLTAGSFTTTTVDAPGALIGDYAKATFSLALGGLEPLSAVVSASGVVTVFFKNPTGGAVNLDSGTINVRVDQLK